MRTKTGLPGSIQSVFAAPVACWRRLCGHAGLLACFFLASAPALAATAVLTPGLSDAGGANAAYRIDAAHIRTDQALTSGGALAGYNFGGAKQLELGRVQSKISRILIRCDLSSLAGRAAQITRARLTLTVGLSLVEPVQSAFPTTLTLALYRIRPSNIDWSAGSVDAVAQAGSVCWRERRTGLASWSGLPGCSGAGVDRDVLPAAVAIGHAPYYQPGDAFVFEFDDPAQLQDWVDHPAENTGFLIVADALEASPADGIQLIQFLSDEANDTPRRPTLTIDYEPENRTAADPAWLRAP